jgi:hypothetical protein
MYTGGQPQLELATTHLNSAKGRSNQSAIIDLPLKLPAAPLSKIRSKSEPYRDKCYTFSDLLRMKNVFITNDVTHSINNIGEANDDICISLSYQIKSCPLPSFVPPVICIRDSCNANSGIQLVLGGEHQCIPKSLELWRFARPVIPCRQQFPNPSSQPQKHDGT